MTDEPTALRPELSDLDLTRRAQREDIPAYEQLVRRYHSGIYGFTYGMTGSRDDAEILTQEVFAKAWKALGHFREQTGFDTWIYCIAVNRIFRSRKKRHHRKAIRLEEFDPAVKQSESYKAFSSKGSVLRKMSLSEFQKKMNDALNTLSEKHRAVVILHDVQKMAQTEVAKVMNCSEGATGSRLDHAHKKLQAKLADPSLDLVGLLALKAYETPDEARAEKNIENTMRAVRTAHKKPSLHHFPDKSMGWMFAQPRYGVAALFILFLALHLLDRPMPQTSAVSSGTIEEPVIGMDGMDGIDTNDIPSSVIPGVTPMLPSLVPSGSFIETNP